MAFREKGLYPALGFPYDIPCERFAIESLSRRRPPSDILFLFKVIHNFYDFPYVLETLFILFKCLGQKYTQKLISFEIVHIF